MKKSVGLSLWLRLFPVLFLIMIPVAFYILAFKIDHPKSGEVWAICLMFLIMFLIFPILILSIVIFGFPLIGGIISLILIPLIILLRNSLSFNEIQFAWFICGGLFLSGVSAIFLGIWNSSGKRRKDKNYQNK
jgi:hypothetical protein